MKRGKLALFLVILGVLLFIGGNALMDTADVYAKKPLPTSTPAPTNPPIPNPTNLQPAGSSGGSWILTFDDEFDGTALDVGKWSCNYAWGNTTSWTQEVTRESNISVSGGTCKIHVEKEGDTWYSGAIQTHVKFGQSLGYFEARIKALKGLGYLNAWWAKTEVHWPPELDIMEVLGKDIYTVHMTEHYGTYPRNRSSGGSWTGTQDLSQDFHVYGAEWTASEVIWYVDGVERRRTSNLMETDHPLYLIFNVHVGADWMGYPDDTTMPGDMVIDYARVWRR